VTVTAIYQRPSPIAIIGKIATWQRSISIADPFLLPISSRQIDESIFSIADFFPPN
jgi:hypothetical protein